MIGLINLCGVVLVREPLPCVLVISKFYLFTNGYTSELS